MRKISIVLMVLLSSANCFGAEYVNKRLGIILDIPLGATAVEGRTLKQLSQEDKNAVKTVFKAKPEEVERALRQTLFTIGYFSGATENGADASIAVSAVNADKDNQNQIKEYTTALIKSQEKKNDFMSFNFTEKANEVIISNQVFLVSKGTLKIKSEGKVTFSMPIHFYVSKIRSSIVTFLISGNEKMVPNLEQSLLSMKIDGKL